MSVGMPANEYLEQFGVVLRQAFGEVAYHVGSSVRSKKWRDVDIRLLLPLNKWRHYGFGRPETPNAKWSAYVMAFSELGRKMTGLPIDFQIQEQTWANEKYPKQMRSAIGVIRERRRGDE